MNSLLDWAQFYYGLGFNVTHIVPSKNTTKKYPYKAPTNDRQKITRRRQSQIEMSSYDWLNATGIGMVLGRGNIRAIDIDHSTTLKNQEFAMLSDLKPMIFDLLDMMKLPPNYPWVVQTPSKGYHILIEADELPYEVSFNPLSPFNERKTKGFAPNSFTKRLFPTFGHFDMRWNLHLTLPPSKDQANRSYEFVNEIPDSKIQKVGLKDIQSFLNKYCLQYDLELKKSGYNFNVDSYYENHPFTDFHSIIL